MIHKNRTCVVILTWNRLNKLKETVKSFRRYNPNFPKEDIIVMDNGSTDGTREWLEKNRIYYLENSYNRGAQEGKFRGWQHAAGHYKFIVFLEDDFPCIRRVPISNLEFYLDNNNEVGYIRLNDKKYLNVHWITKDKPVYSIKQHLCEEFKIQKSNYHFTSNPMIFRTSLVKHLKPCLKPETINRPNLRDIAHFNNFVNLEKITELAKERVYKEFGRTEKTYMQLYMYKYRYQAQLFPYCFKTVIVKRRKEWRN